MWKDQEKQFHQTYLPKKTELIIVDADGEDKQEVKDALWESLQPEFQDIRDHMNLKARLRRAKNG
jgi:hypothetical protein